MPRTTLQLEDDAMTAAKAHAERHRLSLGQAVSELVRQASERRLVTEDRNGLRVVRLSRRSPKVTAAHVDRLREDLP
jgi:phage terminase Nu1 subunit (DNA packaging protein)